MFARSTLAGPRSRPASRPTWWSPGLHFRPGSGYRHSVGHREASWVPAHLELAVTECFNGRHLLRQELLLNQCQGCWGGFGQYALCCSGSGLTVLQNSEFNCQDCFVSRPTTLKIVVRSSVKRLHKSCGQWVVIDCYLVERLFCKAKFEKKKKKLLTISRMILSFLFSFFHVFRSFVLFSCCPNKGNQLGDDQLRDKTSKPRMQTWPSHPPTSLRTVDTAVIYLFFFLYIYFWLLILSKISKVGRGGWAGDED